jgi:hypothetical protein
VGVMNVHNLGWKGKKTPSWVPMTPFIKCLECPCIVHLDLICMSYDKKKGWESNWELDS